MSQKHFAMITEGELLSVSGAKYQNNKYIVLTLRLDSESFESNNIGLKPEQAVRLLRDLQNLVDNSQIMSEAYQATTDSYQDFKKIILDQPVKKKKASKKKP